MRTLSLFCTILLLLTSCSSVSPEEQFEAYLAKVICTAEGAYKAIDAARIDPSSGTVMHLLTETDRVSKELADLKITSFGSKEQEGVAKKAVPDAARMVQNAVALAKTMCDPSQATIDQVTRDYQ